MTGAACPARAAVAAAMQGQDAVGVAVSGGGDSMALLHLALDLSQDTGCRVAAVTVDHALRPASSIEAAEVAAFCAARGLSHDILIWQHGNDLPGNLQAAARQARYGLMAQWAHGAGIGKVLLGHTADDQAETFLMRLSREAGLDGLSAMPRLFRRDGILWARPLLGCRRAALRDLLRASDVPWVDDPSNDDARFDRVRARQLLDQLGPSGIDAAGLARVAAQLEAAREALQYYQDKAARDLIRQEQGDLLLDWRGLRAAPPEILRRCLVAALIWIGQADYAPRRDAVRHLATALDLAGTQTLGGCLLRRQGDIVRITREFRAVQDLRLASDRLWDGRWQLQAPKGQDPQGLEIRALGPAGLLLCPDWRSVGLPRRSLIASPSVWRQDTLIAAPLAGYPQGWSARIVADFHDRPVSH